MAPRRRNPKGGRHFAGARRAGHDDSSGRRSDRAPVAKCRPRRPHPFFSSLLAAALLGLAVAAGAGADPKGPEPRRLALRLSDPLLQSPALERFVSRARAHGFEVQPASESTAVAVGWQAAHLSTLPVAARLQPDLARFPAAFDAGAFSFDGRTYAGKDDALFLADPARPQEVFVVGLSEPAVFELAGARLFERPARPADYEVLSGDLVKEGRLVLRDGKLEIDREADRDGIAARDDFFRSLKREKRGVVEFEFRASEAAAAAPWEKTAARFAGKKAFSLRFFPDAATKAFYTGSSRPADLVEEAGRIRVEIDLSAPAEPDLVSPVIAAAALAAANPALLERRTLLYAAGARRFGRWWGREVRGFSAFTRAAGVEPTITEVFTSDEDVSPVLAVGSAAAWIEAGVRLDGEAVAEKALAEPGPKLAERLGKWRDAAWRQPVKPPARRPLPEKFLRGVAYAMTNSIEGGYVAPASRATLERLKASSVDSISVMPYGFVREPTGERVLFVHRSPRGETDEGIVRAVTDARALGMSALVKPQLWVGGGAPVGDIAMPDDRAWRSWFDSYRRFLVHHAVVAEASGAALFCIGTELRQAESREKEWRDTAAVLRLATGAPLLYAANGAANAPLVNFWDVLDAIGVDFYDPLSKSEKMSDAALEDAVRRAARPVAELAERAGKGVIFTEAGYPAVRGAWISPHDEDAPRAPGGEDAARSIAAVFRALGRESWWKGVYWGKVFSDGRPPEAGERGFNLLGTPAEKAVADGFRRAAGP
jgi:hypothetical protein